MDPTDGAELAVPVRADCFLSTCPLQQERFGPDFFRQPLEYSGAPLRGTHSPGLAPAHCHSRLPGVAPVLAALTRLVAARVSSADSTAAEHAPLTVDRIEVGFQGLYKVGEWTRLRLWVQTATRREAIIVVEAPDADDCRTVLPGSSQT